MKLKISLACIVLALITSCVSHELPRPDNCNVTNPVEDLPWLKSEVANLNDSELGRKYWLITKGIYKRETVFIIKNCCPNCSTFPPPVHSCTGELLFRASDKRYKDISNEALIWKGSEYECTF